MRPLKINLSHLKTQIEKYVKEYYMLEEKPIIPEIEKEYLWIQSIISNHVEYNIIDQELADISRLEVKERPISYYNDPAQQTCIKKKGYEIVKRLGNEYSNKFLLKGNKAAKVERISLWMYKQKNEMKSTIYNEFSIHKKAEELGIGPKTYDTFICLNELGNICYKVIIMDYITGIPLDEWLSKSPSQDDRRAMYNMIKKKVDIMHENGIIHGSLTNRNIIVKLGRGSKAEDVVITDYINSYDMTDKSMWDYNKWIQNDRQVLRNIINASYSYNNSTDIVNYVTSKLIANKEIVIT